MTKVVMLEALNYGFSYLSEAARRLDVHLILLTFDRPYYVHQLHSAPDIRVVEVDTFSPSAVMNALQEIGGVDGLISNTDAWASVAEQVAAARGFPGVLRNTGLLRNKTSVRNRLHRAGLVRSPALDGASWGSSGVRGRRTQPPAPPLVVKDGSGSGSKNVFLARTHEQVDRHLADFVQRGVPLERITIEPYACGPLFSVETWSTEEGPRCLGVSSRTISDLPHFKETDQAFPIEPSTEWERTVSEWAGAVLRAIERGAGPSHIEFIDSDDGPELVEVNCRLGGGLTGPSIVEAGGVDVYELLIRQALGSMTDSDLDAARRPVSAGGYAQVDRFAQVPGPLGPVAGLDLLPSFPGFPQWHPSRTEDHDVTDLSHQGAAYGLVSAIGPNASTALSRAHAAARHVQLQRQAPACETR